MIASVVIVVGVAIVVAPNYRAGLVYRGAVKAPAAPQPIHEVLVVGYKLTEPGGGHTCPLQE